MPFLEARLGEIDFGAPTLVSGERVHAVGDLVTGWDYLTPLTISVEIRHDENDLVESTGISDVECIGAYLQVDCLATHFRRVAHTRLRHGQLVTALRVALNAGEVAQELEVRTGLLLLQDSPPTTSSLAANTKGSRLAQSEFAFRFVLEGDGATFPVEAFDFEKTGLPPDAPWHLHFGASSLEDSFKRTVRLYINSGHEQSSELREGVPGVVTSVLIHGVTVDLLLGAATLLETSQTTEFPDGSVGQVIEDLAHTYLGLSLSEVKSELLLDPLDLHTRLRASTGLLQGGSQ